MGFGERPPPIPAPQPSPLHRPHLLRPAPTDALRPSFTTASPPLPAEPALLPRAGGPGFPKRNAERDFPARQGAAAGTRARPLWLGLTGTGAIVGHEGLGKGQLLKTGPEPWSALFTPARASLSPTSVASRGQVPLVTAASVPGPLLTRSSQLPGSELGRRRGVKSEPGASARPWRSCGYRRLPPGGPSLRRAEAGPPGGQRGPPRRAGPAGAGPAAPTGPGPLPPGPASSTRLHNHPPSRQPKFSRVPNFGRCCGGSCYYWTLSCFQLHCTGRHPAPPTPQPLEPRLLCCCRDVRTGTKTPKGKLGETPAAKSSREPAVVSSFFPLGVRNESC